MIDNGGLINGCGNVLFSVIENCPMESVKAVIEKAASIGHSNAVMQMQVQYSTESEY